MVFSGVDDYNVYKDNVTIIINSCDSYGDVIELFFKAFDEYWPNNKFPIVLNVESSDILAYTEMEKVGKGWGERLIDVLDSIETDYVIMVFDDFILEDFVDENKIYAALDILKNDTESSVFYLNAACLRDHQDDPDNDYRLLKQDSDYRMNSVPSIWKKNDLKFFTRPIDNPWSWEVFGSYRTFNINKNFYSTSSISKNIFKYNREKGGAIYRGKWVKDVVEDKIKKYSLEIDLNERGVIEFSDKVSRPLKWKIGFLVLGYKSIGFKMYKFILRYFNLKLKGYFK